MGFTCQYFACGLSIASDAPIPGLHMTPLDDRPDVLVSMNGTRWPTKECVESVRYVSAEPGEEGEPVLTVWEQRSGGYRLCYSEGAQFVVDSEGRRIEAHWRSPLTAEDAAVFLLGPVLGLIMRLRGTVPLHASGVVVGTGSLLFAGDGGAGKSTTAAAFASLGYPVLADDIVPIADGGGRVTACPSHPRLSVWPDSTEALFGSPDALPRLSPTYTKRYLDLAGSAYRFEPRPVEIEVIYILDDRRPHTRAIEGLMLTPQAALMALVQHTYCNYMLDASMRAREFDVLSRLVQIVPVRSLSFGDDMERLPDYCRQLAVAVLDVGGQRA